ncbi:MAG: NADH:ubiquinone reductase (Na(+)-transporting) subunit B [Fuerstiella sp.]|nr:NADH:ubiquinone reductase (Na(+)-transporting) subunit B [Fuerstiella sp.]
MKFLRNKLDQMEPFFHKGGKLEKLYPVYEALDTFLYTPGIVTNGAAHVRDGMDVKRMMIFVVIALTPCIYMACWNTGYQTNLAARSVIENGMSPDDLVAELGWRAAMLRNMGWSPGSGGNWLWHVIHGALYFFPVFLVTNIVGGTWELIFSCTRGHEINEGFMVTGMLFPLTLPATIPLWQVALGISFGVVIGKEVFGGTGRNILNPALTGRAFLYFAYPGQIIGDKVWVAAVDSFSGPTLLTTMGSVRDVSADSYKDVVSTLNLSWFDAFMGWIPGSMGETSTLACLLGAGFLVITGVGSWRIMAGVLAGATGLSMALNGVASTTNAVFQVPPHMHLMTGGLAFGLVFMATDPVSAAVTDKGRWIYGILIGVMTIIIRVVNPAFPEGIMLAILFGNVFAPTIDYFVKDQNVKRRAARDAT